MRAAPAPHQHQQQRRREDFYVQSQRRTTIHIIVKELVRHSIAPSPIIYLVSVDMTGKNLFFSSSNLDGTLVVLLSDGGRSEPCGRPRR